MLVLSWDDIFVYASVVKINIRISLERRILYVLEFLLEESLAGCLKSIWVPSARCASQPISIDIQTNKTLLFNLE